MTNNNTENSIQYSSESSSDALSASVEVNAVDDSMVEEVATVAVTQQPVDQLMLQKIIEGAILAAGQPITINRLMELFDKSVAPSKEDVLTALQNVAEKSAARGYELKEVASGWRFQVREELAPWVNRLWDEKPQKYSRALLETLALIAYRQPITRGDIEEIRGVAVSSHIMKTLMEREWVKVVGHRDVPGRPSLYATTRQFLDYFNLKNLEDLPSLSEIRDLDELMNVLNLGEEEGLGEKDTGILPVDSTSTENLPTENMSTETTVANTSLSSEALVESDLEEFVDGEEAFETIIPPSSNHSHEMQIKNASTNFSSEDIDQTTMSEDKNEVEKHNNL